MSHRHTFTKSLLSRIVLWRSPCGSHRHYSQIEGLLSVGKWHSAQRLKSALYKEKPPSQRSWPVLAVWACLTIRVAVTPVEGVCQQFRIIVLAYWGKIDASYYLVGAAQLVTVHALIHSSARYRFVLVLLTTQEPVMEGGFHPPERAVLACSRSHVRCGSRCESWTEVT